MKTYDAIIIGSGQAGNPLAKRLAGKGWKVALIEKEFLGGTCINYGCTPTKAMIASAKMAFQAKRALDYGVKTGKVSVSLLKIMARKNEIVHQFRNSTAKGLKKLKVDVIYGTASFTGHKQVSVLTKSGKREDYTAEHMFINTGTRTAIPEIDGLTKAPYLTSATLMELGETPKHLVIIGAGYIALEFAQMYKRFGSKVTLLSRSSRFLPNEDTDVADEVQSIFKEEGIEILTGVSFTSISHTPNSVSVQISSGGKKQVLKGSHLLIAAGRTPNTDMLSLENTGVKLNAEGYIHVNNKLETNIAGIYALGDVKGGPAFTHISYNDYLVVCKNILDKANNTIKNRPVPYCMFIDPELGRVGITEEEAKNKKLNYKVAKIKMAYVARGIETGETKGFMKAIVDAKTKKILGVCILGANGGETMSLLQIAMMGGITYEQLRETIFAHPTFSESVNNLFMSLDEK